MFIDRNAYLARIGFEDSAKDFAPTLDNLVALHTGHAFSIPFDNFDVHLNGDVSLDKGHIFDKLVYQGRGGYCYEMNGLFYDALENLGYDVAYLTSRPMLGYREKRPRTHMLLRVKIGEQSYICDQGFTGMSIIEPILLKDGEVSQQYGFAFKVLEVEEGLFQLQTQQSGEWVSLYEFDLQEQLYIDFSIANYFNSTSPESICTRKVIVSRYSEQGRAHMLDNVLRLRGKGKDKDIEISSRGQLSEILQDYFAIMLSNDDLDRVYQKIGG